MGVRKTCHAQCHVVQYKCNGVQHLYSESNRHGRNILVVKDTAHTRLKEIHAKATVIASASFDVGRLKISLKEEEEEEEEEEER